MSRVKSVSVTILLLLSVLAALHTTSSPAGATDATPTVASVFVPITPCRLVDTRIPRTRLGSAARTFAVATPAGPASVFAQQGGTPGGCGIPAEATAVKASLSAVAPSGAGFLRAWPAGAAAPNATFVNYRSGSVTNSGALPIATDGSAEDLTVRAFGYGTDLVIDVLGYFVSPGAPLGATFEPITPCRIVDTRLGGGPVLPTAGRTWQVAGSGARFAAQGGRPGGCAVPSDAVAVEVTITATAPRGGGFLRAWPADSTAPVGTVLNYPARFSTTNTAAIAIATDASTDDLSVRAFEGTTDLVADIAGYYRRDGVSTTGTAFTPLTPCRVADTRVSGGMLAAGTTRTFRTAGVPGCDVPAYATAVEATISVVDATSTGFLRAWPAAQAAPTATISNFHRATNTSNTAALAVTAGTGGLTIAAHQAAAHVVVDIDGWYAPITPPPAITGVSGGGEHSCASLSDGRVSCWGSNLDGELGDGTTTDRPYAAPVHGITDATGVSAGADHTCAPRADGTVTCWGANSAGQLGDGTTTASALPVQVTALVGATSVAAGLRFTCARIDTGAVSCWGINDRGQLGVPPAGTASSPTPVTVPGVTTAVAVSAGHQHACAILADGSVTCWGDDSAGELGDGPGDSTGLGPVTVSSIGEVSSIGAGYRHTCAVSGGTVRCWGSNANGRLGTGTTTSSSTPVTALGVQGAVAVSAGGGHTCALVAGNSIRCWGYNYYGQVGDGTTAVQRTTPTTVVGLTSAGAITSVGAGSDHTCAVVGLGVRCWGFNTTGQLGDGTNTIRRSPVGVTGL